MIVSSEFCYLGALRLAGGSEFELGRYQIEAYDYFEHELQLSLEVINPMIVENGTRRQFMPTFPGLPMLESLCAVVKVGTPGHLEFSEFIEPPFDVDCGDIAIDTDYEDIDWRIIADSIRLNYSKFKQ